MTLSTHLDIWSPPPALPRAFFLEAPLEVVRALLDAPYPFVENEIHIHLPKKIKKSVCPGEAPDPACNTPVFPYPCCAPCCACCGRRRRGVTHTGPTNTSPCRVARGGGRPICPTNPAKAPAPPFPPVGRGRSGPGLWPRCFFLWPQKRTRAGPGGRALSPGLAINA